MCALYTEEGTSLTWAHREARGVAVCGESRKDGHIHRVRPACDLSEGTGSRSTPLRPPLHGPDPADLRLYGKTSPVKSPDLPFGWRTHGDVAPGTGSAAGRLCNGVECL